MMTSRLIPLGALLTLVACSDSAMRKPVVANPNGTTDSATAAEGVQTGYSVSEARFVRNIVGFQGPESVLFDISFRYQLPLGKGFDSLDLFYDIFNLFNRTNYVAPSGNRNTTVFNVPTAAQFPRQMQFGIRLRF